MSVSSLVSNSSNTSANAVEVFYTSPTTSSGTQIARFTATNNGTSSVSFKAYIYDSSGNLVQSIIPFAIVKRDLYNLGASLIGQIIPAGGSLRIECSAANGLNYNVAGTVLS